MLGLGFRSSILDLPIPIICDILSRLPLKSILICRYLCKTFRGIILEDPYFAKLHLPKSPQCLFIYKSNPNWTASLRYSESYVADLETGRDDIIKVCTGLGVTEHDDYNNIPKLVGSCNGLLCFVNDDRPHGDNIYYYISNPMLGECYAIPSPSRLKEHSYKYGYGFGFCSKTNEYKLIQNVLSLFSSTSGMTYSAEIYTLGTKSWRSIKHPPCQLDSGIGDTCLNGTLHWLPFACWRLAMPMPMVQLFDLDNECFGQVPMPADIDIGRQTGMILGLLEGCLCICIRNQYHHEVWVMSDYGVKESWTKKFTIDFSCTHDMTRDLIDDYQIIKLVNNGDKIWLCNSHTLICYSPKEEILQVLMNTVRGGGAQMMLHTKFRNWALVSEVSETEAVAYVPNFFSLKDILKLQI